VGGGWWFGGEGQKFGELRSLSCWRAIRELSQVSEDRLPAPPGPLISPPVQVWPAAASWVARGVNPATVSMVVVPLVTVVLVVSV